MTFTCDKCNKVLSTKGHLNTHIKHVHDKIKNVKCTICEYTCSKNSTLKSHVKGVHDKIKDITCPRCDYTCSTIGNLKIHMKQVHDKIKDIKCNQCDFLCSTTSHLTCHVKQVHDKIKDIKCNQCEFLSSNNSNLTKHIKQVHEKIKDYKCSQCEYTCYLQNDFKKHIKRVHERPLIDKRMSLGEYAIYDYLTKNNIIFEREKTFNDLHSPKNKKLRYDFYIQAHNILIEFDGAQHFKKVRWQHDHTDVQVEELYNYLVECDHLKNEYADANKIKLYRIKYTDIKNIDNILKVLLYK